MNLLLTTLLVVGCGSSLVFGWGDWHKGCGGNHPDGHDGPNSYGRRPRPDYHSSTPSSVSRNQETRTLSEIYRDALREGGKLVVYAGGDTAGQLNTMKAAFESRFPGVTVELIVDFSKNHDARIDHQLKVGNLSCDVAHLQTLQDFDRWKNASVLYPYKPLGWEQVYSDFKDQDGYWTGILVDAFSNLVNVNILANYKRNWPTEARDFLQPRFKGKIVTTWPNDDDAVLFWYKQVIDKYGWGWLESFLKNEPMFVRGTQYPSDMVYNGSAVATFSTDGMLRPGANDSARFVLPEKDPFVSWAQRAAIFNQAKNKEAAKLYLNWWLDYRTQNSTWYSWSVRKDVPVPTGFRSIFDYKNQTNPNDFHAFMSDRAEVERFKQEVRLYVGEVTGPSPPEELGRLGLFPTKMLAGAYP